MGVFKDIGTVVSAGMSLVAPSPPPPSPPARLAPAPWLETLTDGAQGFLEILRAQQAVGGYYDGRLFEPSLDIIRRSRVLAILCPYGQRYLTLCLNEALGPDGVKPRMRFRTEQARWDEMAMRVGVRGESLAEIMEQALAAYLRDGEAFILLVNRDGMKLQLVDAMNVDHANGITYDSVGAPVQYRIGYDVYPASQVIHLFRRLVPDQKRGLSAFVPAWEALGWLWQVEDRVIANIRQSAESLGFFELPENYYTPDFVDEQEPDAGSDYSSVDEDKIRRKIPKVAGEYPFFPSGTKFQPIDLGRNFAYGPQFAALRKEVLAGAAAALGVSYAALAGEYSGANYSSLRQGRLDDIAFYKRLQAVIIGALQRIYDAWLGGAGRGIAEWTTPHFAAVDPQREAQVASQEVATAIRSRSEIIRARGGDPDAVFAELVAERELLGGAIGGGDNAGQDERDSADAGDGGGGRDDRTDAGRRDVGAGGGEGGR